MNVSLDLDMAERFNLLGLKKDEFKGIHIYLLSRTVSDKRSIVFPPDFGFYLGTSALLRVFPKEPFMLSSLRYLAPNEETVWHQKARLDLSYLPVSNVFVLCFSLNVILIFLFLGEIRISSCRRSSQDSARIPIKYFYGIKGEDADFNRDKIKMR